jgi:hypothetical protein
VRYLVLAAALSGMACRSGSGLMSYPPRPFHQAVGCWTLWAPDTLWLGVRSLFGSGVNVQLSPEVQEWMVYRGRRSVVLWATAKRSDGVTFRASWTPGGSRDSIWISWGDVVGLNEVNAYVAVHGDSLAGAGAWATDAGGLGPFAVWGRRRRC